ncbi:MAG: RDD family protein [Gemmatimonadota bacterium]
MSAPKRIITPEHFKVANEILGLPLASPSRRAFAMASDLILVAVLVKAGGVFLGIAAGFLLLRASAPKPREGLIGKSVRNGLRLAGAIVLFVVILNVWDTATDRLSRDTEEEPARTTAGDEDSEDVDLDISARDVPALAGSLFTVTRARDSSAVGAAAKEIFSTTKQSGASVDRLYEMRDELLKLLDDDEADSSDIRAIDAALLAVAGPRPVANPDSTIKKLERDVSRYRAQRDSLNRELEEAREKRGIRSFIAAAADDLGVGFGWSAVFFTAFLALWRGQTPGKRIAGVRVLRLDGKPMGWWISFERFGGYAASLSVGMLGFAQILWDRNRQGLHDKACETVVVIDSDQARACS